MGRGRWGLNFEPMHHTLERVPVPLGYQLKPLHVALVALFIIIIIGK